MKFRIPAWLWLSYALLGVSLEGVALFNGVPNDTLTGTIVWYLPQALIVVTIGWIGYHFRIAWRDRGKQR